MTVFRGGEAHLAYGALPEWLTVKPGVFDLDELAGELQSRLRDAVPAEERPAGQPFGMVSYRYRDGGSRDYFHYDGEFAEGLFVTACKNVLEGSENTALLLKMVCRDRTVAAVWK
ncbi:MAG: hypothetical protein WBM17_05910 [Anaerolineales bacterium]